MAPPTVTEDYYMVLELDQNATPEHIIKSYRRLALKLHPDRNPTKDATEAFQLLGRAYETLKDESNRRAYDLTYPLIKQRHPSHPTPQTPRSPPAAPRPPKVANEAAEIAALQKLKQTRGARWQIMEDLSSYSILELQGGIEQLEAEIHGLDDLSFALAAIEALENISSIWVPALPSDKAGEDFMSEEEKKEHEDRQKQEIKIKKDMCKRRLLSKRATLDKEKLLLVLTKKDVDTLDQSDDKKIRAVQGRKKARDLREWHEREEAARNRLTKIRKQQKREERQLADLLKVQQEMRAAEQRRREEEFRKAQEIIDEIIESMPFM